MPARIDTGPYATRTRLAISVCAVAPSVFSCSVGDREEGALVAECAARTVHYRGFGVVPANNPA